MELDEGGLLPLQGGGGGEGGIVLSKKGQGWYSSLQGEVRVSLGRVIAPHLLNSSGIGIHTQKPKRCLNYMRMSCVLGEHFVAVYIYTSHKAPNQKGRFPIAEQSFSRYVKA